MSEYQLLDSGNEQKLERVGDYTLIRPAPQAIWSPQLPPSAWKQADAIYRRGKGRDDDESESGRGKWDWRNDIPRSFPILFDNLSFEIKLTDFGHLGLFAEQRDNWQWMRELIRSRLRATNGRNLHVLNLFAYTGGSTLATSQAGAHLVHLDAAKGVVDWARDNAKQSHLADRPIRWLVDDALKYVKREGRRNHSYQGIILDPPSFGRGPKGEVFKIEKDLLPLLEACTEILADDALFVLYSCHTPGFTPLTLHNQLTSVLGRRKGEIESGEMTIVDSRERPLPSGVYGRWVAGE